MKACGVMLVALLQDGSTPLHYAAAFGQSHMVEILTDLGCDVNIKDNAQNTPLHIAAGQHKNYARDDVLYEADDCWQLVAVEGLSQWSAASVIWHLLRAFFWFWASSMQRPFVGLALETMAKCQRIVDL